MNLRGKDACPRSHERGAVPTVLDRVHCSAIARLQRDRRQRKGPELHHSRHAVLKCILFFQLPATGINGPCLGGARRRARGHAQRRRR